MPHAHAWLYPAGEGGGQATPHRQICASPSLVVVGDSSLVNHLLFVKLARHRRLNALRNGLLGRPADLDLVRRAALPADGLLGDGRRVRADVLAVCWALGRVGAGEHLLSAHRGVGVYRRAVLFLAGGVSAGMGDGMLVYRA